MKKRYIAMSGLILLILCFVIVTVIGDTYTIAIPIEDGTGIEDCHIEIEQDKEVIRLTDTITDNGFLILTLRSVSRGKAFINVSNENESYYYDSIYVHSLGIITIDNYFGRSRGYIFFPVAVVLYLIVVLYGVIKCYRIDMRHSIYQYKNIRNFGWIIYLVSMIWGQTIFLKNDSLISGIKSILDSATVLSIIALPFAFIVSILVTISNIQLVRKEGNNWRNMLGCILGVLVCLGTVLPIWISEFLQRTTIIDVHNERGMAAYVEMAITTSVLVCDTYLECILLSTVIHTVRASKRIPSFDKDYILILGCQISADGSLTPLLKGRTDRAIEFAKMQEQATGKKLNFVPSGGKGSDEIIPEGKAIENYLFAQGIPSDRILTEDRSINTYENMKNSMELIKTKTTLSEPKLAFSTTSYHVFRSGVLAEQQGIHAEGIGSKTKSYFYINAFVREFIATLYSERRIHIRTIIELMTLVLVIVLSIYWSNVL